ncbi:alpha/beta fold hydrolase [Tropicimonas sp. IMCC6043]|uniref:alpha/beta fold hydrolase n=1 Tax=Tropicimonas sp. IMCC6043 TaxID=2510645 RepID=UPI00101CEFF8|nr:alpha/beta hydrolase [Tropicimonas sp. IMCC6043]RYH06951.1 alpha/beta hydrolase [Tropicimonas sp. IMCC6043]
MERAPFFDDIADAPKGASAHWAAADDGVRLRLALLAPPPATPRGTILLFPGRTEYVEKYGPAAGEFHARGYACLSIDWRGQGLADRLIEHRPDMGHVARFADFQRDVAAMVARATALDLPRPWFLLAHSMGGGIGLRALHEGLPVDAAVFTGPMWGIVVPAAARPLARHFAGLIRAIGLGQRFMPSTGPVTYVLDAPFEDNTLTTDPGVYEWMRRQLHAHPELAIGGPSVTWFHEALTELARLRALPAPALPCLTWVGANERIVEITAIREVMSGWRGGRLTEVPGAEHELMMERPATRRAFFDTTADFLDTVRGAA